MEKCENCSRDNKSIYHASGKCPRSWTMSESYLIPHFEYNDRIDEIKRKIFGLPPQEDPKNKE